MGYHSRQWPYLNPRAPNGSSNLGIERLRNPDINAHQVGYGHATTSECKRPTYATYNTPGMETQCQEMYVAQFEST